MKITFKDLKYDFDRNMVNKIIIKPSNKQLNFNSDSILGFFEVSKPKELNFVINKLEKGKELSKDEVKKFLSCFSADVKRWIVSNNIELVWENGTVIYKKETSS